MKTALFAGLAAAALVAGCNKPAEAPAPEATSETTAPEAVTTEAVPAVEAPAAGVVGTDLPADNSSATVKAEIEKEAAAAGVPATKQSRTTFACDNEEKIEVRFFPDQGIAVLVRGGQNTELNGEAVPTGFKYTNGQTTIQGKGDELTLNVGMMAGTKCTAKAG